jgi:hypothetical protein
MELLDFGLSMTTGEPFLMDKDRTLAGLYGYKLRFFAFFATIEATELRISQINSRICK